MSKERMRRLLSVCRFLCVVLQRKLGLWLRRRSPARPGPDESAFLAHHQRPEGWDNRSSNGATAYCEAGLPEAYGSATVRQMQKDDSQKEPRTGPVLDDTAFSADLWTTSVMPVLERIAEKHLMGERGTITLDASDLVQEAYLRLSELKLPIRNRQHFLSLASKAMRRVLVDHARRKLADKRGARPVKITLRSCEEGWADSGSMQLLELDSLLNQLARFDERKAQLVELHYFGGLQRTEMSEITGLSTATLGRELSFARSWIMAQLDPN